MRQKPVDIFGFQTTFGDDVRVHTPLPLVHFEQVTMHNTLVVFHRNGEIAENWSRNMTIRVYAEGYEADALRVVIDRGARIRLQRGAENAYDAE